MKYITRKKRGTTTHAVFMLGVKRDYDKHWTWMCDGHSDPLCYWRKTSCREYHLGFISIWFTRQQYWIETSYHEFHPAFPPGLNTPPPSCQCDKNPIACGEYCTRCWPKHNEQKQQKANG
jgi:hypothetical protein